MSSKKTKYLNMHDWIGTDPWRRSEISENFQKLDDKALKLDDSMAAATATAGQAKTTAEGIDAKATSALTNSTAAVSSADAAVQTANAADTKATAAKTTSEDALTKAQSADATAASVQNQFDQVVINGDSSIEAAQARVDTNGQTYTTLKQRLDAEYQETTATLAETDEYVGTTMNATLTNYLETTRTITENKPMVTFVDDDGGAAVLTKLKPLFIEKGIPLVVALIGTQGLPINDAESKEMANLIKSHGWEVAWHTQNHEDLSTFTEAQLHADFKNSRVFSNKHNFAIENIVYPFGGVSDLTQKVARQYFKSGAGVNRQNDLNTTQPFDTYRLIRSGLGSYVTAGKNTLIDYKAKVDEAVATNSWLIFMTHVWHADHTDIQHQHLIDTIDYVKSLNIDVVTLKEGLKRRGSVIEKGDILNKTGDHFIMNPDGSITSNSAVAYYTKDVQQAIQGSTPATFFKKNVVTIKEFYNYAGVGFPTSTGTLKTFRSAYNDTNTYQEWHPTASTKIFKRVATGSGTTWSAWEEAAKKINSSATLDFTSINPLSTKELTMPFTGATATDFVIVAPGGSGMPIGIVYSAYCDVADTIRIRIANVTNAAITVGSKLWRATVIKN